MMILMMIMPRKYSTSAVMEKKRLENDDAIKNHPVIAVPKNEIHSRSINFIHHLPSFRFKK